MIFDFQWIFAGLLAVILLVDISLNPQHYTKRFALPVGTCLIGLWLIEDPWVLLSTWVFLHVLIYVKSEIIDAPKRFRWALSLHTFLYPSLVVFQLNSVLPEKVQLALNMICLIAINGVFPFFRWFHWPVIKINPHRMGWFYILATPEAVFSLKFLIPQIQDSLPLSHLFIALFLLNAVYRLVSTLSNRDLFQNIWLIYFAQSSVLLASMLTPEQGRVGGQLLMLAISLSLYSIQFSIRHRRFGDFLSLRQNLGLSTLTPNFHRIFLINGFILIGIPGSLTFVAEDLIFHILGEVSMFVTITAVAFYAVNGMAFFRIYQRLFLGEPATVRGESLDISKMERIVLSLLLIPSFVLGIAPGLLFH